MTEKIENQSDLADAPVFAWQNWDIESMIANSPEAAKILCKNVDYKHPVDNFPYGFSSPSNRIKEHLCYAKHSWNNIE